MARTKRISNACDELIRLCLQAKGRILQVNQRDLEIVIQAGGRHGLRNRPRPGGNIVNQVTLVTEEGTFLFQCSTSRPIQTEQAAQMHL